jgi:Ca2+-binding RTX toxin-like protein
LRTTINGQESEDLEITGIVVVKGGPGDDHIFVSSSLAGHLVLDGGDGLDTYDINFGRDSFGNDLLTGTVVVADSGAAVGDLDTLVAHGTAQNDTLKKAAGTIKWRQSGDSTYTQEVDFDGVERGTLNAGAGNDTIVDPNTGNFTLLGGPGDDTITIAAATGPLFVDGGDGSDAFIVQATSPDLLSRKFIGSIGSVAYVMEQTTTLGPVTIADSGTTGTDSVKIVGSVTSDALVQTATGFSINSQTVTISGLESASVDGGGGAGDSYTVVGTPTLPTTVQGVADSVVNGTAGNDNIRLTAGSSSGEVKVYVNGAAVGTFKPTGHMIVHGLAGDDTISADGLNLPVVLYGDEDNDTLTGGSADDIIFGGTGDDLITGAAGNDFLIGGGGKDRIVGSAGNDILVSGDLNSGLSLAAMQGISQAWAASHSATNTTVDELLDEITGDTSIDQLTGGAGADLFFISMGDTTTDFQLNKPKANKDGDVVIEIAS